jgi:hypothetical protein
MGTAAAGVNRIGPVGRPLSDPTAGWTGGMAITPTLFREVVIDSRIRVNKLAECRIGAEHQIPPGLSLDTGLKCSEYAGEVLSERAVCARLLRIPSADRRSVLPFPAGTADRFARRRIESSWAPVNAGGYSES